VVEDVEQMLSQIVFCLSVLGSNGLELDDRT